MAVPMAALQALPLHAQRDGDQDIAPPARPNTPANGICAYSGPLDLDAHRLYIRPQTGEEQQQRRPVVHLGTARRRPISTNKGLPDGHEPQENAPQQNEPQPSLILVNSASSVRMGAFSATSRCTLASSRWSMALPNSSEIVVQLGGDDIHRHRPRAVKTTLSAAAGQCSDPTTMPMNIHREPEHLRSSAKVSYRRNAKGHFQLSGSKDVDNAADHRKISDTMVSITDR